MNCLNQKCRSPKSRVTKSFDDTGTVKRWRSCAKCGARWTTDERPNPSSLTLPESDQGKAKPQRLLSPMGTNGQAVGGTNQDPAGSEHQGERSAHQGGVGGGSPSFGSGQDPGRKSPSSPSDPVSDSDQGVDRAREPPATGYRVTGFNHLGTTTPAFLRVYNAYPNKVGKNVASQIFREMSETYPDGEVGLSQAILAAFARGMLKVRPYHDDKDGVRFCPALERFLERRLWEDEVSPHDGSTKPGKKDLDYA